MYLHFIEWMIPYQSARCLAPRWLGIKDNLSTEAINQSDSKPSTMAKTTEMSMDVSEKIKTYTMLEAAW